MCSELFLNSSLSPVVLFRRRLKSVAEVIKEYQGQGIYFSLGGMLFWVTGRLYVGMVRVVLSLPFIPGIGGFLRICMVFTGGFLMPFSC